MCARIHNEFELANLYAMWADIYVDDGNSHRSIIEYYSMIVEWVCWSRKKHNLLF